MKKLILIAIAAMFCMQGFSQDSSMMKSDSSMGMGKMKSYITMTNGKIMVVKNDMPKELSSDMTLPDGTIVKKSGTILMKNGQTKMLKEGERWYLGKKMSMNGGMDSSMMPKKDSMR